MSFVVPFPDTLVSRVQLQKIVQSGRTAAIKKGNSNSPQFTPAFSPLICLSKRTVHYRLGSVRAWTESRRRSLAELANDQPVVKLRRDA